MKKVWPPIWIICAISLLFVGAAFVTLRAAAQTAAPAPPPVSHPPPSAPEESATITDDPTIAPDASESADHNVSFPTDI